MSSVGKDVRTCEKKRACVMLISSLHLLQNGASDVEYRTIQVGLCFQDGRFLFNWIRGDSCTSICSEAVCRWMGSAPKALSISGDLIRSN